MFIFDNFLDDPAAYRAECLSKKYSTEKYQDREFPNMCQVSDDPLWKKIFNTFPGSRNEAVASVIRLYPYGQANPTWIHADNAVSNWTGILFLNPPDHEMLYGSLLHGTAFFSHVVHGPEVQPDWPQEVFNRLLEDSFDGSRWRMLKLVPGVFNRLVVFPGEQFHAMYPKTGFGTMKETARMVQVFFFN